ncbi:MAG: SusD/RagB family nutrient-binding outer membrane lipoprotein [Ignavibacteriaceae bacterium]
MKINLKNNNIILIVALLISLVLFNCKDYLTDPSVTEDPNRATNVTPGDLLVAMQVSQFFRYEGEIARTTSVWMQQLAGVDRQLQGIGEYIITEGEWSGVFNFAYVGGGLIDIRKLISISESSGLKIYAGIGKIWEALDMGYTASLWGDIPFSEAANPDISTPKLDKQFEVYASIQKLLDQAITDLNEGGGSSPGGRDFVYNGDVNKWIQFAHSLKARYYMHWAEVDPSNYQKALTEAQQGISSNAGDFHSVHSTNEPESNGVYQFWRDRDSYIRAGKYMIDLLKKNNDPRLQIYFSVDTDIWV